MSESFPNPPKPFSPEKCSAIQNNVLEMKELQKEFEEKLEYAIQEGDTTALERAKELKVILEERLRKLQESLITIAEKLRNPEIEKQLDEAGNDKKKISEILGISEDLISTQKEALSGGMVYHTEHLYLNKLKSAEGLTLPEYVGGGLHLGNLKSAEGLKLPEHVGGHLYLQSLKSAEGLKLPAYVGGHLDLNKLKSAEGIKLPEYVGGGLDLLRLTNAEELTLPEYVGGYLYLQSITSAEGLKLPAYVGGYLDLESITSAEGLKLPAYVGLGLNLQNLTSAEGLTFDNVEIKGKVYFREMNEKDFQELKKKYPNLDIQRI
jgi:hypothetical protein